MGVTLLLTPQLILENGFNGGGPRVWRYTSSNTSTDITATGFFAGMGRSFNVNAPGSSGVGMQVGDALLNQESAAGVRPGRCTLHGCISATLNSTRAAGVYSSTAGYDVSVASCSRSLV